MADRTDIYSYTSNSGELITIRYNPDMVYWYVYIHQQDGKVRLVRDAVDGVSPVALPNERVAADLLGSLEAPATKRDLEDIKRIAPPSDISEWHPIRSAVFE